MRRSMAALIILTLTAACSGGGDDDDDGGGNFTRVEFDDFEEGEFGACGVVGSVVNESDDFVCDVFLTYEARDFDDDVFASTIVNVDGLFPDESAQFGSAFLDDDGEFIDCADVESIDLVEHEEFCD